MRNTIILIAAFAAAASALPAQAQSTARSQSVSTAGLDLGTPAGRGRFQRRVAAAIETVCGSYAGASASEQGEIDRCRRSAWSSVETQLASQQARRNGAVRVASTR